MHFKPRYIIILLLFVFTGLSAQPEGEIEAPLQQQNLDTDEKTKTKLGIKFTMGFSTFRGDAFDNERLNYGFGAGVYNIVHLNKSKTTNFHWELNFSFKGSRFGTVNDTAYSKISLSYMEIPAYFSVQVANTPKNQPLHLLMGVQFGYLFRSTLNKAFGKFGEVKTNLPFKRFDFSPAIGIRKEIGHGMSMQLCLKVGLVNIYTDGFKRRVDFYDPDNKQLDYRDLSPTPKDGTHKAFNQSIEFSLLF